MSKNNVWCIHTVPDESGDGTPDLYTSKRKAKFSFEERIIDLHEAGYTVSWNADKTAVHWLVGDMYYHMDLFKKEVL